MNFGMRLACLIVFAAAAAPAQDAEKLIKASDCSSCHAVDHQVVGPAYSDIAKRYAGQADAPAKLAAKIRDGGGGMTTHTDMTDAQRQEIAKWILSQTQSSQTQSVPSQTPAKTYAHTLKDGTAVQLDFPMFVEGKAPKACCQAGTINKIWFQSSYVHVNLWLTILQFVQFATQVKDKYIACLWLTGKLNDPGER